MGQEKQGVSLPLFQLHKM
uniref:Uncharacterized protein n=1 Tax=Anguilla anguilla TaxID=7936 RepID=A0A0E9TFL2_ANGAN